jgi:CubicO group peptidase (beta-lactamase class C family)
LFTALGIGKLIEDGKISLSTKVNEIDRKYTGFIDENVTIQNLLSHTSGIYDYYDEELVEVFDNFFVDIPWYNLETSSDYFPLFKNKKMKFLPNEKFSYSKGGYIFLGIIIEKISGELYRDFIRKNILMPGNMINSGFYSFNELPKNTANGYKIDRKTTNIFNLPIRGASDGGMYTNSTDLKVFWNKLFSHNIFSSNITKEFLKTQVKFDTTYGYGSGI